MSDFNHDWLDKPYNELTDEQLKAVADWHQDWSNKDQHRACVHMMALRTQIAAERERADRAEADAEMGRRWRADSSLETWFPYTAEELARTKAERDALRERVARLEAALDKIESDTYDTSIQAIARTALEDK